MTEVYESSSGNLVHLSDYMAYAARAARCIQDISDNVGRELDGVVDVTDDAFDFVSTIPSYIMSDIDFDALEQLYQQSFFRYVDG